MQILFSWMDRTINWVLALLMAAMVVVITAQVWYRFILNDPLSWSEELGRYLFVWISFLGAAAGVRYQVTAPNKTAATRPGSPELNVPTSVVCIFTMSCAEWTSSSTVTSTPRPRAPGSAATATAL